MNSIPPRATNPLVSELIDQLSFICLTTRGRTRRLNRFWMGVELIMGVSRSNERAGVEMRLLDVARYCGLAPNSIEDDRQLTEIKLARHQAGSLARPKGRVDSRL
jgi:hypothetical protein